MSRALVLGGGGVTGVAWELGVLSALLDAGIDVVGADLIVGTSAGAAVAAQITGAPFEALVTAQLAPETKELAVELDLDALIAIFSLLNDDDLDPDERRAQVGKIALDTDTIEPAARREIIAARLPAGHDGEWPDQAVVITAVDAHTGEFVPIDRTSGIPLVDAVAASCAVPGVWPPSEHGGRRFVDGGVRTSTNADLATGHDIVLILSPLDRNMTRDLDRREVPVLEESGSTVAVLRADTEALQAMGPNPLDPAMRAPAFAAGRRQGEAAADDVGWLWEPDPAR